MLLMKGADPKVENNAGLNPMDIALRTIPRNPWIMYILEECGFTFKSWRDPNKALDSSEEEELESGKEAWKDQGSQVKLINKN